MTHTSIQFFKSFIHSLTFDYVFFFVLFDLIPNMKGII